MKLIHSLFVILFLLISSIVFAQNNIGFQWQRTFAGSNGISGKAIARTTDGGFVVSGESRASSPNFLSNTWIGKYNSTGALAWQKVYGGSTYGTLNADVIQTSDGGYLIVSSVYGNGGNVTGFKGGSDIWVLKLNNQGDFLWQRCLGGSDYEGVANAVETSDGGYIIAGSTNSKDGDVVGKSDSLNRDVWIVKLNNTGSSIIWQKVFKGSKEEEAKKIIKAKDGSFVLTGYTNSNDNDFPGNGNGSSGLSDIFLIKMTNSGSVVWSKTYHNYNNDIGSSVVETPDSGFLIAGSTGDSINVGNAFLLKVGGNSSMAWQKRINTFTYIDSVYFVVNDILIDTVTSGYFLSGFASSRNYLESAGAVKMDTNGNLVWKKIYSNTNFQSEFYGLIPDSDLSVIYVGRDYGAERNGLLFKIGSVNRINGVLYLDANSNNINDPGEQNFNNALVKSQKGSSVISGQPQNGAFKFDIDTGAYTTTVQLFSPYYNIVPGSRNTNFSTYFNVDSFGFAIQPIPNKQDLLVHLIPASPARPGFKSQYVLNYKNVGTTTIANGTVKFVKDPRTSFSLSLPVPSSVVNDTAFYNYTNLKPLDSVSIGIELQIAPPPNVNINDTLKLMATILPVSGDLTPADDTSHLRQRVIGSYDPNDKQESFAGKIPLKSVQDGSYINYVIRFQNTGNDTAFFVRLLDTLDNKLDWNSFQMIGSSHAYNLTIKDGNKLNWFFDNIKLPDSTTNLAKSIGYVAFRIKPKNTLVANDLIQNKASIYFDYNLPIVTNTANTIVSVETILAVREVQNNEMKLVLGPNPSSGYSVLQITGKLKGKFELRVIDMNGKIILEQTLTRNTAAELLQVPLQLQKLSPGMYIIQLQQKGKSWSQKIVLQ
jgi:hypothetical protein